MIIQIPIHSIFFHIGKTGKHLIQRHIRMCRKLIGSLNNALCMKGLLRLHYPRFPFIPKKGIRYKVEIIILSDTSKSSRLHWSSTHKLTKIYLPHITRKNLFTHHRDYFTDLCGETIPS